jgi:hypothetical protein
MSDADPRGTITLPSDFHFGHLRPNQTKPEAPAPAGRISNSTRQKGNLESA